MRDRTLGRPGLENTAFQELLTHFVQFAFVLQDFGWQEKVAVGQIVVRVMRIRHRSVSNLNPKLLAVANCEQQDVGCRLGRLLRQGHFRPVAGEPCFPLAGRTVGLVYLALTNMAFQHPSV